MVKKQNKKNIILIDGNAIIHRSFHALPLLTTKQGELVNAVYGFASTLLSVIEKFKPKYIAVSFDLKGPTFRHKKFEDYKATRTKAPDELYSQIDRVKEVVRAFNIPIYEKDGFEADDVIGTIAKKIKRKEAEVVIVTGDLDTLQLVDENIKVWTVSRGINKAILYDKEKVKERYGLEPAQLKDYKGIRGDTSDNIPGVKGIGDKGATNLLQKYKSLENVYRNISEIKGATKDKLERDKSQAFMSKELGTIRLDVPLEFDLEKCLTHNFNRNEIVKLFQELNFFSLIKRLPGASADANKINNETENPPASSEFALDEKYEIIKNSDTDNFITKLKRQKEFAIVVDEGSAENGLAFSWKTGRAHFLKFSMENMEKIRSILEDEKILKIGFDLKKLYKKFKKNYNLKLNSGKFFDKGKPVVGWDVKLASYLLDSGEKIELERIIMTELGEETIETGRQMSLGIVDMEEDMMKICRKADYVWKLKNILFKKLAEINQGQKNSLKSVFENIEMPLIKVLAEMEDNGIQINKIILEGISKKISKRIKNLEKIIYKLADEKFNINSPKQLTIILFEKLKISTEGIKKTKTGFSTAASELNKLRAKHKIISKIEEYRELFKLKTTYIDPLPKLADDNFRIHTTFNQTVTATGRLSSENPNLQNIPIRTDLGKMIRTAFEPNENCVFVGADYSQIELRVVAHLSEDKKLIEAFIAGEDVHTKTAAEINKVTLSKVTKKMRQKVKALNFGVIYGMGSFGFAQSAGIEQKEAKKFIDDYMREFQNVAEYIKKTKEFAKENGFVETETGRRRYLPEINSPNFMVKASAERMAINMPVQGLAADIMKLAMIAVYSEYDNNENVKMILQVHDEIILEVREDLAKEVGVKIKEIMENVYKLRVPLIADVKIGHNWGEL